MSNTQRPTKITPNSTDLVTPVITEEQFKQKMGEELEKIDLVEFFKTAVQVIEEKGFGVGLKGLIVETGTRLAKKGKFGPAALPQQNNKALSDGKEND